MHHSYCLLSEAKRADAVKRGLARKAWISAANGGNKEQNTATQRYAILADAIAIDEDATLQAVAIGRFQIIGSTYLFCGFVSVHAVWQAFLHSEVNRLRAFKNILAGKELLPALRAGDFGKVETGYNGGGQNDASARFALAEAEQPEMTLQLTILESTRAVDRLPDEVAKLRRELVHVSLRTAYEG